MENININNNSQTISLMIMALIKRLDNIENKLEKKIPVLMTEEAISEYKKHLENDNSKKGKQYSSASIKNYVFLLNKFLEYFSNRNVAEITTEECNNFLMKYWNDKDNGTKKQRQLQLSIFFNFCINHLKRKGNPIFHNPCDLLDNINKITKQPVWIPVAVMKEFLQNVPEKYKLAISIMATAGLRINELLKLQKRDVNSRILTIRNPKSGKDVEYAVIPKSLMEILNNHIAKLKDKDKVIQLSESAILKTIKRHAEKYNINNITNHSLRKWCASYWQRKGEHGMVNFVLRHSPNHLKDRYIAPLNIEEAMRKQDLIMEEDLF